MKLVLSSWARFWFFPQYFDASFEIEIVNVFQSKVLMPLLCGSKPGLGGLALCARPTVPSASPGGSGGPRNSSLAEWAFGWGFLSTLQTLWPDLSLAQPPAILFEYPLLIPGKVPLFLTWVSLFLGKFWPPAQGLTYNWPSVIVVWMYEWRGHHQGDRRRSLRAALRILQKCKWLYGARPK